MIDNSFKLWIDDVSYHRFYRKTNPVALVDASGNVAAFTSLYPQNYVQQYQAAAVR